MARLCEQKAQHSDLKTLCSNIASEQDQEKSQMETWRTSWHAGQEAHVPQMPRMQEKQKKMMATLQSTSGERFDHAFLMSMTAHHQDGMPDMKSCITSAKYSELQRLCGQMSEEQRKEIAQMQTWMKEWGGMTGSAQNTRSTEVFEQTRDVVCKAFTVRLGKLPGSCHMSAGRQMVAQHVRLDAPDCSDRGARLVNHVKTWATISDHLLKTSDLTLDSAQSRQLPAVIGHRVRSLRSRSPHVI